MEKLTEQEKIRRQKMQDLIDMGIDPFGHAYERTTQIQDKYAQNMKILAMGSVQRTSPIPALLFSNTLFVHKLAHLNGIIAPR